MIPLRLTVKNFMCYRDNTPTLHLENIHVACLCGDNGHGKTALLDSITWSLWGQARARTQEELVHQGQLDMSVELDFLVRDQLYRVNRRYARSARSRQGHTILELQIESDDGFRPITGNTVRETEARIKDILHLDYDTFVNTAFLLQGRADMFTSSTPSKRKECLAEVLDLSYYGNLEEDARAKSRGFLDRIREIDNTIELRKQEIDQKPSYEEQMASINASLAELQPELETRRQRADETRRTVGLLQGRRKELDDLRERLSGNRMEIEQLQRQVDNHKTRVDEYEKAIENEADVRRQYAILKAARSELERMNQGLSQKSELDQQKADFEREIAVQKERLTSAADQLQKKISEEIEPKAARLPQIEQEIAAVRNEETKLEEIENRIRLRRQGVVGLDGQLQALDADFERKNELDRAKADLQSKIAIEKERLSNQTSQLRDRINKDLTPKAEGLPQIQQKLTQLAAEEEELEALVASIKVDRDNGEEIDGKTRFLRQSNKKLLEDMADTRKKFDMLEQGDAICPLCKKSLEEEGTEHLRAEYESQGLDQKRQYTENDAESKNLAKIHGVLMARISENESAVETRRADIQGRLANLKRDADDSKNAGAELQEVVPHFERLAIRLTNDDYAHDEFKSLAEIEEQIESLGYKPESRRNMQDLIRKVNDEATQLEVELIAGRQNTLGRTVVLEREHRDATEAQAILEPSYADLETVRSVLQSEGFAQETRQKLDKINSSLSSLGYDAEQHQQTREQVTSLDRYENLHRKLSEATENLPRVREEMDTTRQMLDRRQQEISDGQEQISVLEEDLKSLPLLESRLQEETTSLQEIEKQRDTAQVQKGVLQQQIDRCDALQAEIGGQQKQRNTLTDEKSIYDELTGAFGKNGIQALIIESAMPQLEADANDILGRLTDNRMFLKLEIREGRRDPRTHLPTEEMDIRISDELGTRNYEMFSGGEAFRINFALRIALSKLLARRSGAPLPILFIDEGFGSQDRGGQERLTEAIQSIQDDFQKIIVITHIDQIKEAFPVRIEVIKTESGSKFVIV